MPLSYYNSMASTLEERDLQSDRANVILQGGAVNNTNNLFPIVIRDELPPAVRVRSVQVMEI